MVIQAIVGGVFSAGGGTTGLAVGTSDLDLGRFSVMAGSARFFGFGFSTGRRGAGREARSALCFAFLAFSRRWRLRLSSRSFSRTFLSAIDLMTSDRAL